MEYTLAADILTPTSKQYTLTCLVCTVHMNEKPVAAIPTMTMWWQSHTMGMAGDILSRSGARRSGCG